jgi:hypothetical protein
MVDQDVQAMSYNQDQLDVDAKLALTIDLFYILFFCFFAHLFCGCRYLRFMLMKYQEEHIKILKVFCC